MYEISKYRQVRILIMYDLPMDDTENRRYYTKFRREILKLGCYLVQYSVYSKVLKNELYYKSFVNKVKV